MGIKQELAWRWWRRKAHGFPRRFEAWLRNPDWLPGDHEVLLAAFLSSGGAALACATQASASRSGCYLFDDQSSSIGLQRGGQEYDRAMMALRTEGYAILPWRLSDERVQALSQHLQTPTLTLRSDDPSVNGLREHVSFDNPRAEKYDVPVSSILASSDATELMLDRGILQFAQDYLGSIPRIDICAAWFSFPMHRASNEAATTFHFDLDRTRWLKVFFFLTDVTPTSGAHVFIPRTHRDGAIPLRLRKRGYARMDDDDVRAFFPEETWAIIGGRRGTILIEDTRGIHKGLPVMEGHRLVLQFQYSQNLFGSKPSVFGQGKPEVGGFDEFASRYPDVLQGMSSDSAHGGWL